MAALPDPNTVTTVAHVIQQAVAPVFLLTGIGAILAVLSNRLARVVDRFRLLNTLAEPERSSHLDELTTLLHRARWVHRAVTLCTIAALFICIVVAALFVGSVFEIDPSRVVSILFIFAMLGLILGLMCLLREIYLATGSIKLPAQDRR